MAAVLLRVAVAMLLGSSGVVAVHGRNTLQATDDGFWETHKVLDFGGFFAAASRAAAPGYKVHIDLENHILAKGQPLDIVVQGERKIPISSAPLMSHCWSPRGHGDGLLGVTYVSPHLLPRCANVLQEACG